MRFQFGGKTEVLVFHSLALHRQQQDHEKTTNASDLIFQAYISPTRKLGAKCSKAVICLTSGTYKEIHCDLLLLAN